MRNHANLWLELECALQHGLIRRMEEISRPLLASKQQPRIYGTRIWFHPSVTNNSIELLSQYIQEEYGVETWQEIPLSLVVWEQ